MFEVQPDSRKSELQQSKQPNKNCSVAHIENNLIFKNKIYDFSIFDEYLN